MAETIRNKIDTFVVNPVVPKEITDIDVARAYIDSISSARPIANFFGGDILEPIFDFLYFPSTGTPTISATSSRRASTAA